MPETKLPRRIDEILRAYNLSDKMTNWYEVLNGHINRTFCTEFDMGEGVSEKRLLQQINTHVFKNPLELMENVVRVTDYLREHVREEGGDPSRETLKVFLTTDGKTCFFDSDGLCWRMYNFIDNSYSYDTIENDELFFRAGEAFGKFQSRLSDFPIDALHETIPDFHDTYKRFLNLKKSVSEDKAHRASLVKRELDFVYSRESDMSVITSLLNKGRIPLRVTHNDTKLNNIMFDKDTKEPICVVDLDTVMPGSSLYDFGDAIRFGANTAKEDEKDLSKVSLDLNLYEKYTEGYLKSAGGSLTDLEVFYLPFSAKLLTLECGMRFLTDYIDGDVYFSTSYPEHNLDRCRTQFALVYDIERKLDKMKIITEKSHEKK